MFPRTCPQFWRFVRLGSELRRFAGALLSGPPSAIPEALLTEEVLDALNTDNENPRFAGILEPSPGLEPGTASLPSRFGGGKRG